VPTGRPHAKQEISMVDRVADTATAASSLRMTGDVRNGEAERLTERVGAKLDRRLARWDADRVEGELSVKERDSVQQKVTLELWIHNHGRTHFVATSALDDLAAAVNDVATDVARQVGRFVDKQVASRRG
jgi:ribosome-associated translation inhibitor RaiA